MRVCVCVSLFVCMWVIVCLSMVCVCVCMCIHLVMVSSPLTHPRLHVHMLYTNMSAQCIHALVRKHTHTDTISLPQPYSTTHTRTPTQHTTACHLFGPVGEWDAAHGGALHAPLDRFQRAADVLHPKEERGCVDIHRLYPLQTCPCKCARATTHARMSTGRACACEQSRGRTHELTTHPRTLFSHTDTPLYEVGAFPTLIWRDDWPYALPHIPDGTPGIKVCTIDWMGGVCE